MPPEAALKMVDQPARGQIKAAYDFFKLIQSGIAPLLVDQLSKMAPADARRSCECWSCSSGEQITEMQTCEAPSRGCSITNARGCFGFDELNAVAGECDCGSGEFSAEAIYSLEGTVDGLSSHVSHSLILSCESESGVMSVSVIEDGVVSFPYRLSEGQMYQVHVLQEPADVECKVICAQKVLQL